MSCGCHMYDDDMGDARTIIVKDFVDAAAKAGMSKEDLMKKSHEALLAGHGTPEITDADYEAAGAAMGQTKEDAMNETRLAIEKILAKG